MKFEYITLKNIIARLKSESPTFFKKLKGWGLSISAFGGVLVAAKEASEKYMLWLPDNVPGYLIAIGATLAFVSTLTVNDVKENDVK